MKKKTLVTICCLASSCYAQPRQSATIVYSFPEQNNAEQKPVRTAEEKKSCSMVQEALSEDDFFFDFEDEECTSNQAGCDESIGVVSRLQDLIKTFGVQAVLGAMYISEKVSGSYAWLVGCLNSLNKKA